MTNVRRRRTTNVRRIRKASNEELVVSFNYKAVRSESGANGVVQHVVARLEPDSVEVRNGSVYFVGRNINRVTGADEGFRTYRMDRITGTVEIV